MIAVYIDNTLEKFSHEIKYSFDFIFKTLGYEFKYINRLEQLLEKDILVFYGLVEPNLKEAYILAMRKALVFIPCDQELLIPGSIKKKDLSTWRKELTLHKAVPVLSFNDFEVPINYYQDDELFYGTFKFDLIGNIFFNLTNFQSITIDHDKSLDQVKLEDNPLTPHLNHFCWLIEQCLIDAVNSRGNIFLIKKEYWPNGESGAFAISHNVDKLQKWNAGKIMKSAYEDLLLFYKIKYLFENLISKIKYLTTNIEEYWNFDLIRDAEDQFNIRSTYFWGTESETSEDVDYRINSKEVAEEIELLIETGHEIALLASRKSHNNDILKRQKQKIAQITLREKIGVRQNGYLYEYKVTDELVSKNNFAYDSSRMSNDNPGFVNGLGFPFHTFIDNGIKSDNGYYSCKNLELPIVFSDEHLLLSQTKVISQDSAMELLTDIISSIKITNGLLNFNFSISNFTELDYDIELFSALLSQLKSQNFFNGTLLEIADWWRRRENLEISEYQNTVDLYFPERIESCTLVVYGNVIVKEVVGLDAEIEENCIKFKNVMPDKKVQIILEQGSN